jgi:hypothetical protein
VGDTGTFGRSVKFLVRGAGSFVERAGSLLRDVETFVGTARSEVYVPRKIGRGLGKARASAASGGGTVVTWVRKAPRRSYRLAPR